MSSESASTGRVKVELAYKVNMGNFETYEVRYSSEEDVKSGETNREVHERVEAEVSDWLWPEVEEAKKQAKKGGK